MWLPWYIWSPAIASLPLAYLCIFKSVSCCPGYIGLSSFPSFTTCAFIFSSASLVQLALSWPRSCLFQLQHHKRGISLIFSPYAESFVDWWLVKSVSQGHVVALPRLPQPAFNRLHILSMAPLLCLTFSCHLRLISSDVYSDSFAALVSIDNRDLWSLVWVPYYNQFDAKVSWWCHLTLRRLVVHASRVISKCVGALPHPQRLSCNCSRVVSGFTSRCESYARFWRPSFVKLTNNSRKLASRLLWNVLLCSANAIMHAQGIAVSTPLLS